MHHAVKERLFLKWNQNVRGFGSQSGADEAWRRVDWCITLSLHGVVMVPKAEASFCWSFLAVTWWRNAFYCIALPHVLIEFPRNRTRALLCSLFWAIIIHFANFSGISCSVWIFPNRSYHSLRCSYGASERGRCPISVDRYRKWWRSWNGWVRKLGCDVIKNGIEEALDTHRWR
jgi:hypothetical protein